LSFASAPWPAMRAITSLKPPSSDGLS